MTGPRLMGKVALITGAASGIGRRSAELFAEEGASVVAVDLSVDEGEKTAATIVAKGGQAVFVRADVSVASDCEAMVASAESNFGRLDVLFNNAGIMHSQDSDAVDTAEQDAEGHAFCNTEVRFLSLWE